jgi:L-lactate dehydrogenase
LGEHGDSEVAAWSLAHIAGVPIDDFCPMCKKCNYKIRRNEIFEQVRDSAYHIIDYKGATYYAIGLTLVKISEAILRDENSILTVSTLLNGQYDIEDVCLSIPCVVGKNGIKSMLDPQISKEELRLLQVSAQTLKEIISKIGICY